MLPQKNQMKKHNLSGHNSNSFSHLNHPAISLKGRNHLFVVTGSAEGYFPFRSIESGHTGSFHSRRLKPHSPLATSSGGIHRRVKNPARRSRDDIDRQRLKSLWLSGSSQARKRPGLLPGDISLSVMLGRASSSKRFSGFSHLPEPADKFSGHSNFSLSFNSGILQDMIVHTAVNRVRTNHSGSSFAESPTKVCRSGTGDFPLGTLPAGLFGAFRNAGIASDGIRTGDSMESGDFKDDDLFCQKTSFRG